MGKALKKNANLGTIERVYPASETLDKVKSAMKIDYFKNDEYLKEIIAKYQEK